MRGILPLVLCIACGKDDPVDPGSTRSGDQFSGIINVNGTRLPVVACHPKHEVHTFVELVTSKGKLRFEDARLYWNPEAGGVTRGPELTCSKLDRSWGGGIRTDGTAYWRGTLAFRCVDDETKIEGDLTLDCGDITANERAQLDGNRKGMQDQQRGSGSAR